MNAAAGAADYWTPENKDAEFPMPIMNNPYRWDRWSSRLIKSTDNIRMREITLGVNIPVKRHIEQLRVYFRSNNPFMIWGKYRKGFFKTTLTVSFQFHHTQMDGAHAGRFLENLQQEINKLK